MADVPSWLSENTDGNKSGTMGSPSTTNSGTTDDWSVPPPPTTATVSKSQTMNDRGGVDDTASVATEFQKKTWGEFWGDSFRRDGGLIFVAIMICVLSNIPYGQYAVYPFTIFSTWIHETCHGLAAWMVGYKVNGLELYSDGSGLAKFTLSGSDERRGFVTSAGYQGTAIIGMLLLVLRRTKRGPRIGIMFLALCMVLTLAAWIRNLFGILFIAAWAIVLLIAGWTLTSPWMRGLYLVVSASTALNAIFAVRNLYGDDFEVNGNKMPTDAHTMGELKFGGSTMWASIWLGLGLVCLFLGFVFPIPGPEEMAEFTCCRACQKIGCFACCNAPGCRLWAKMRGGRNGDDNGSVNDSVV